MDIFLFPLMKPTTATDGEAGSVQNCIRQRFNTEVLQSQFDMRPDLMLQDYICYLINLSAVKNILDTHQDVSRTFPEHEHGNKKLRYFYFSCLVPETCLFS